MIYFQCLSNLLEVNMPGVLEPAIDPVCGMEVNENVHPRFTYQGKTYFFCSKDCKDEFEAVPEDFVGYG